MFQRYPSKSKSPFPESIAAVGFAICAIEGVLESIGLVPHCEIIQRKLFI